MIYILSGDIRSGKTTALLKWTEGRNDVDGLLCPDGENGKRYFLKIKSQEEFELEVESESESEDTITIGRFHFLKSAFDDANNYLLETNERRDFKHLIIDELGRLELKNHGLHDAAKALIPEYENDENYHLILIVRESLLNTVLKYYEISKYSIFELKV